MGPRGVHLPPCPPTPARPRSALCAQVNETLLGKATASELEAMRFVGLLDIFGFER